MTKKIEDKPNKNVKIDPVKEPVKPPTFHELLRECLILLNAGICSSDARIISRMLRRISTLRQTFDPTVFREFVRVLILPRNEHRANLLLEALKDIEFKPTQSAKDTIMTDVDAEIVNNEKQKDNTTTNLIVADSFVPIIGTPKEFSQSFPYIELFLTILGMMVTIDVKHYDNGMTLATDVVNQYSASSQKLGGLLVGKAIFYAARLFELVGKLSDLRRFLMESYREFVLRHNLSAQAITLNLLLRNFLQENLYDQVLKFLEKAPYPEGLRSNAQHARYLYYLARIHAIRLDYSEALSKVTQAIRKAPQEGSPFGKGFRVAAHRLSCVIQLLTGDIPDRQIFNQKDIKNQLLPYAQIVQAVRSGDLILFNKMMEKHELVFENDSNLNLIKRLHQNVIRIGLRKINCSYSQISLNDIALKLGLSPKDDTQCIVARAIADGVIDAIIDTDSNTMNSNPESRAQILLDHPRKAFHGRIAYCLQLHNEVIKAMQYPEPEGETRIEEAEARRKEHQEQLARAEKDEYDDGDLI